MSNLSLENLEYLASLKALLKLNDLTREQSQMSSRLLGKTNPMTIGSSIFVPATQGFVPSSPFRRALAVPPVLRNLNVTPSVAQVAEAIQRLQPTLPSTSEGTSIRNHFSPPKLRQEYPKSSTRLLHPRFVNAYNLAQPLPSKGLPSPLPHPVAPAPESSVSSAIETKKIPERNVSEHSERVTPPLESGDPDIRVDKVQAALRSKHQRGKKRSDLNHVERLELTRTRNREHAKSTRYVRVNGTVCSARVLLADLSSHHFACFSSFVQTPEKGSLRRVSAVRGAAKFASEVKKPAKGTPAVLSTVFVGPSRYAKLCERQCSPEPREELPKLHAVLEWDHQRSGSFPFSR